MADVPQLCAGANASRSSGARPSVSTSLGEDITAEDIEMQGTLHTDPAQTLWVNPKSLGATTLHKMFVA